MTKPLEHAIDSSQSHVTMPAKPPEVSYFFIFQCLYHQTETIASNIRSQAKKLNDFRWVYGFYGLLDGLSTSFSMLKYTFDIYYANSHFSSADLLHDFLLTPEGIVIVVFESLVLAGLAISGNVFDDDSATDQPQWKKSTATFWRYFRDLLKALKNAYKGVRNVFFFISLVTVGQSLNYLILPLGLALGALSAINRMFIRFMRDERKVKMKQNETLLKEIKQMSLDASQDLEAWGEKLKALRRVNGEAGITGVQSQSGWYRALSYLAATYSGFLDAPYLFLGAISLSILNPSLLIVMATFSVFFVVVCIATRIFEEYNYQRLLFITQTQIELTVCTEELKLLFKKLETIHADMAVQNYNKISQTELWSLHAKVKRDFEQQFEKTAKCKDKLQKQSVLSTGAVMMSGLRNGIDAYGAIASLMFVIATVYLILWIPFPPLLLLTFASVGIALLAGFVGLALLTADYLKTGCDLHSMLEQPIDLSMYKNSFILIANKELIYIDQNSKKENVKIKDIDLFKTFFNTINPQKLKKIHLSDKQINQFITLNGGHTRKTLSSQTQSKETSLSSLLDDFKKLTISENSEIQQDDLTALQEQILDRLSIDPSPQFFFQEWFEVLRLLCSGGGKGMRSVDETMVSWQDVGNDGHYHDTWIMAAVAWACAIVFAISFALRGLARLGREKDKKAAQASNETPKDNENKQVDSITLTLDAEQTLCSLQTSPKAIVSSSPINIDIEAIPESVESDKTSPTASPTAGSMLSFFNSKPLTKAESAPILSAASDPTQDSKFGSLQMTLS